MPEGTSLTRKRQVESIRGKFADRNLVLELVNFCNLRCPLCSTGSGACPRPKGAMSLEQFRKFFSLAAPIFDTVILTGSGEPTLHPQFLDVVRYIALDEQKHVVCCTNGNVSMDHQALVESGLRRIYFDIDGLTQEQHETYRKGSSLATVKENMRQLLLARGKASRTLPSVHVDVLIGPHNEHDVPALVDMARGLGADGVRLRSLVDDLFGGDELHPRTAPYAHQQRQDVYSCPFKRSFAGILSWDGEMQLCCMTPHHAEPVIKGNAFGAGEDVLEVIDSDEFLHLTRRCGDYGFCRTCFYAKHKTYWETQEFTPDRTGSPVRSLARRVRGRLAAVRRWMRG